MNRARKTLSTVVAAVMLFVLSGCVVLEADFSVDEDLKVSGTLRFALNLEEMGSTGTFPRDHSVAVEEEFDLGELPPGATITRIDDGEFYGYEIVYDKVEGYYFDLEDGDVSMFAIDGDVIVFNSMHPFIEYQLASLGSNAQDDEVSSPGSGHLAITFPGKVIKAPGASISGNTATWDLETHTGMFVSARANLHAEGTSWLPIALILVATLAATVIISALLVLRNRKKAEGSAPHGYVSHDPQYGQHAAPYFGHPSPVDAQHSPVDAQPYLEQDQFAPYAGNTEALPHPYSRNP